MTEILLLVARVWSLMAAGNPPTVSTFLPTTPAILLMVVAILLMVVAILLMTVVILLMTVVFLLPAAIPWETVCLPVGVIRRKLLVMGHKKKDSAESLILLNLKSNTMKNTLQRYVFSIKIPNNFVKC